LAFSFNCGTSISAIGGFFFSGSSSSVLPDSDAVSSLPEQIEQDVREQVESETRNFSDEKF
jgi:hypothetical protein